MKKFAFFLPQFHEIKENDLWWENGFTEWTHVKRAKPLFNGHKQPVVPLNNNYYNLLDKNTVVWQTELQKKYKIDGLIYYHYYFNGKKLLEKPAENLLRWKDIDQKFFFCWANHTWYRSDEKVKRKVLMEQSYGSKEDWKIHFEYLSEFFLDNRYEKKDNKPLFMIYDPNFSQKEDMLCFFDEQCKQLGFDGICIIEMCKTKLLNEIDEFEKNMSSISQFCFVGEPAASISERSIFRKFSDKLIKWIFSGPIIYDGNKVLKIRDNLFFDNILQGILFEWDNTPRHGKHGYVITPLSKEIFFSYMDSLKDDEYVFLYAWNEWAEGMVLEPTEKNRYKYLEWILEWTNQNM